MKISKTLYVTNRADWRKWLRQHHDTESEVWLIYYKKHTGRPRIPYDDAVEEALCFGWIDSIIKRIDDEKYVQRFTPRKGNSQWSDLNRERVRKLIKEGRMTRAGSAKINEGVLTKNAPSLKRERNKELALPAYFKEALMRNGKAWENFKILAPSYRRNFIGWVTQAKKQGTRDKRLREAVELLAKRQKLGMK
jgi:uncharacterized protein YdeI (YjbR/CyaY-like superfamily)